MLCKKGVLEISQNSQKSTCARDSFLITLQAWPATLLKKVSGTGAFNKTDYYIWQEEFGYDNDVNHRRFRDHCHFMTK